MVLSIPDDSPRFCNIRANCEQSGLTRRRSAGRCSRDRGGQERGEGGAGLAGASPGSSLFCHKNSTQGRRMSLNGPQGIGGIERLGQGLEGHPGGAALFRD